MYKKQLLITSLRIGFMLCIYTICRGIFLAFNWGIFSSASIATLAESFVLGLRFDLSTILLLNSLFLFLSLLPIADFYNETYQRILKILFVVINIPAVFINLADASYFSFKAKRTTYEIFGLAGDVLDQSLQLAWHYWYIIIFSFILLFLIIWKYPRLKKEETSIITKNQWQTWIVFVLLVGFIVLGIRGGLQLKPICPNMAFVQKPNVLGNLVLNTPFVMIQTSQLPVVTRLEYFKDETSCIEAIKVPYGKRASYTPEFSGKPNIVIIILESFSSEYTSYGNPWKGYTPFLDSISAQGLFFNNHFSNGRTSMDGLPAIIASIPSLMIESYITSTYQSNHIVGLAEVLHQQGYHNSFYHGGKNGTMGFDMFSKNAGFTHYYGRNEYTGSNKDDDENWGIFDHHYWQYVCKNLSQAPQPFLSGVFTLSSHQPYTIPQEFDKQFTEGPLPIIRAVKYADYSLKMFFESARKQPWFDNTLFILTADHTQEKIQPWSLYNDYHVPLLFYSPKYIKPYLVASKITQHVDIAPSVLDLLHISPQSPSLFGHSIFDSTYSGRAILFDGASETSMLFHKELVTMLRPGNKIEFANSELSKNNSLNSKQTELLKQQYSQEIKAIQQFHNNGLLDNNWFR